MSGPKGSSTKEDPLGAAGMPARSFTFTFIKMTLILSNLRSYFTDITKKTLLLTAGILFCFGVIVSLLAIHKKVYLVVDGKVREVSTWALTVNGLLQSQEIILESQDQIFPPEGKILWGGESIYLNHASQIHLITGEETSTVISTERHPANILLQADIQIYPGDRLIVNGRPADPDQKIPAGDSHTIQVYPLTPLEVDLGSDVYRFISNASTLGEALYQENITLYEGDQLIPSAATPLLGVPLEVSITSSKPIQVKLPNQTLNIRSAASTVGDALADAALSLQGLDYSIPAEDSSLTGNEPIQIIRVKEEYILNQEPIDFTTEYQATNDLELDQIQILKGGEFGLKAQRIRVVMENDSEVSREVEKEWVVKQPQPRIIGYGTKINVKTANTPDGEIRYWRKITAYATSYNKNCPGCDNWTASGTRLKKGTVAVTLEWYRYMKGAKIYIPGYGFGTIEDVGGGIPGTYWVDLGYEVKDYVPWSQNVDVYFLAPPPSPDNIMYILN